MVFSTFAVEKQILMQQTHYPKSIVNGEVAPTPPTINVAGRLLSFDCPKVMGILNATPDSFYADSRCADDGMVAARAREILSQGGDIIDVGACSTRPGSVAPSAAEEWQRLDRALSVVRSVAPDAIVSVDTYRAEVARKAVERHGVQIVNDVSGGSMDKDMFATVAALGVPYILTHIQGTPADMQCNPQYGNVVVDVTRWLAERVDMLHQMGVADVIVDPGFGLGKTLEQNYELLAHLGHLRHELPYCALMVGVSRKSMVCKPLGCTPSESLNGTTALHAFALHSGAHLLRVHDVREAVEVVQLHALLKE